MVRFQKLTKHSFLTLHRHNVHRQQRQLSKFLMRYQQFTSHAYCGASGPDFKMASQQEKAFCVLRLEVSRSVITVQLEIRARFRKDAPSNSHSKLQNKPLSTSLNTAYIFNKHFSLLNLSTCPVMSLHLTAVITCCSTGFYR
jgi:hypothetical protein